LIAKNVPTEVAFVDGMRTVKMEGVSCGCGGTHVEGSGEIGEVQKGLGNCGCEHGDFF
jgi:Ser-tRNA(Ala) deacylase AlaX